jgi:hypothetical protein
MKKVFIPQLVTFFSFVLFIVGCQTDKNKNENKSEVKKTNKEVNQAQNVTENLDDNPKFPNLPFVLNYKNLKIEIAPSQYELLRNPFSESEIKFKKIYDTLKYKHFPPFERAKVIEKYSIEQDKESVSRRDSSVLIFKLKNGKSKTLTNHYSMGEMHRTYHYRDYLKEIGFYVCFAALYEGSYYILINDTTGEEFELNGIPKISKDKKRLMSSVYDNDSPYNDGGLYIWKILNQKIELELSFNMNILIWNTEWVDNQTIRFEVLPENLTQINCMDNHWPDLYALRCKKAFELKITENQ